MTEEERIAVPASTILRLIHEGKPVELNNVAVEGNLDFSGINPSEEFISVKSTIQIVNSSVIGKVNLENVTFLECVNFAKTFFREDIDLNHAIFEKPASFISARFDKGANFEGARFMDGANFRDVLSKSSSFKGTFFFGDADFSNAKFIEGFFSPTYFKGCALFTNAKFELDGNYYGARFEKLVRFSFAKFNSNAVFKEAKFYDDARLRSTEFTGSASFEDSEFNCEADFTASQFSNDADFSAAQFKGPARFWGDFFKGNVRFEKAKFGDKADFNAARFHGDVLTFRDATFVEINSQEDACRRAKNVLAKAGNRDGEEYHFYREMEAKRIQKGVRKDKFKKSETRLALIDAAETRRWSAFKDFMLYDILEFFFVQKIFGYGIHPFWLFGWWLAFVIIFTCIYWIGGAVGIPGMNGEINQSSNLSDYLWFSIATAATPGYALYKPLGDFKFVAGIEAILGTFMWAAFITTFGRKFSR